jgi:hypothetical protein
LSDKSEEALDVTSPRIKIRIESLSDMVFGLALSIGSLTLIGNLLPDPIHLLMNILIFGFGFLIIVMVWLGYSRTISVLPVEVPSGLYLNLALLFCVAIEPYLLYVLFSPNQELGELYYSSIAYGLDVGLMFIILATLARLVLKEENSALERGQKRRLHPFILERFKRIMTAEYIVGGAFLLSALPIFWIPTPIGYLRFVLWYSSFVIFFALRSTKRPEKKEVDTK